MRKFLGFWASDEGADCSIGKRVASCILPRKRRRNGLRAFDADLVAQKIQRFQRGADQTVNKRAEEGGVSGR